MAACPGPADARRGGFKGSVKRLGEPLTLWSSIRAGWDGGARLTVEQRRMVRPLTAEDCRCGKKWRGNCRVRIRRYGSKRLTHPRWEPRRFVHLSGSTRCLTGRVQPKPDP